MESKKYNILSILQSSFVFRGLPPIQLRKLLQKVRIHTYKPRHLVIEEDVINDKIFIIIAGLVKIYKITPEGKEVFLAIERTNDYLGVMDLTTSPATATIETLTQTSFLILYKKDVLLLLQENPFLWEKLYHIILLKLKEYTQLQEITQGSTLYQKTYQILDFISRLSKNNVISLSHETIAHILGATRPRVTEALHSLRDAKKITLSPKRIELLA